MAIRDRRLKIVEDRAGITSCKGIDCWSAGSINSVSQCTVASCAVAMARPWSLSARKTVSPIRWRGPSIGRRGIGQGRRRLGGIHAQASGHPDSANAAAECSLRPARADARRRGASAHRVSIDSWCAV